MKNNIVIITGTGEALGMGHLQRILTLADLILEKDDFNLSLFPATRASIPPEFAHTVIETLPDKCALIIRDMRDSTTDETQRLKKIAPLLVIDDAGEGRFLSDYAVDLLPNPGHKISMSLYREDFFLYGYNFTRGLIEAIKKAGNRFIDIAVYTGSETAVDVTEKLKKILPRNAHVLHLTGSAPVDFFTGEPAYENLTYPEILLGTKVLITHFGITLFEGSLCGCSLFTLNPTGYHSELTALAKDRMNIIDLGLYGSEITHEAMNALKSESEKIKNMPVDQSEIVRAAGSGAEKFYEYIRSIIRSRPA